MGIETILGSIAAPVIGSVVGGALGGKSGGSGPQTVTTKNELSPEVQKLLYGTDGNNGWINQIMAQNGIKLPQGLRNYQNAADNYIGMYAPWDMGQARDSAFRLMKNDFDAPTSTAAQGTAAQMSPTNNFNLNRTYNELLNGQLGNNQYLAGGIQKGINQGTQAFQDMQTDLTRNLTENVLPSIRSNSIGNGQYGGSRQGIAEGKALNDFTTNMTRAAQRQGSNAVDSAIAAQAGQYNTDMGNRMNALNTLSGQQFGANQMNAQLAQQMALANLGNRQQSNMQNGAWRLANNQLNSQNKATGINAVTGLLNNMGNVANQGANSDLARMGTINSMIAPYMSLGQTQTQSQPMYSNQGANILGGAMLGSQLFGNLFGGGGGTAYVPPVGTMTAGQVGGYQFPGISGLNFLG